MHQQDCVLAKLLLRLSIGSSEWARPGAFPQLQSLGLDTTAVAGSLPTNWSMSFRNLTYLSLAQTQLSGTLPPGWWTKAMMDVTL